jgi:hypothetical protein
VEASSTPTICRLPDSRRHQLSAIALGEAVDIEAAKPKESLDVQLGYAINFWTVILGGSLFMASAAVKAAWFYFRKRQQVASG